MTGIDRHLTKKGQKRFLDLLGFEPGTKKVEKTFPMSDWCLSPRGHQILDTQVTTYHIFNLLEVVCYLSIQTL